MDDEDCSIVSESVKSKSSLSRDSIKASKKKKRVSIDNLPSKSSKVLRSDKSNDRNSPTPRKKNSFEDSELEKIHKDKLAKEKLPITLQPEEKENIGDVNIEPLKKKNKVVQPEVSIESTNCTGNKSSKLKRGGKGKNDDISKTNLSINQPKKRKRCSKQNVSPHDVMPIANPIFKMFKKINEKKQNVCSQCDDLSTNDDVMIIEDPEIKVTSKCCLMDAIPNSSINNSTSKKDSGNTVPATSNVLPAHEDVVVPVLDKTKASVQSPIISVSDNSIVGMDRPTSNSKAIDGKSPTAKRKSIAVKRKLTPNQGVKSEGKKRKQEKVEKAKSNHEEEIKLKEIENCETKNVEKELQVSSVQPEGTKNVTEIIVNDNITEIICVPDLDVINMPSTSKVDSNDENENSGVKSTLAHHKKRQRKSKQIVSTGSVSNNTIFKMFKKIEQKENKESDVSHDDDILIVDKQGNESSLLDVTDKSSVSDDSISENNINSPISTQGSSTPIIDAVTPVSSKRRAVFSTPKTPLNDLSTTGRKDSTSDKSLSESSPVILNKTPTMKRKMTPMQILRESEKKKSRKKGSKLG